MFGILSLICNIREVKQILCLNSHKSENILITGKGHWLELLFKLTSAILLPKLLFFDNIKPGQTYSYKMFMQMHDIESLK